MTPKTTLTSAAMKAVPKLVSSAFNVRSSVTRRQKPEIPTSLERSTNAASGMRMRRVR